MDALAIASTSGIHDSTITLIPSVILDEAVTFFLPLLFLFLFSPLFCVPNP